MKIVKFNFEVEKVVLHSRSLRVRTFINSKTKKPQAMNYTTAEYTNYKDAIKKQILKQLPENYEIPGKEQPLSIQIKYYYPIPKSRVKKLQNLDYKVTNPDGDNLGKGLWDCFSGVAIHDDAQISSWSGEKRYHNQAGKNILIDVIIMKLDQK